MKIAVSEEFVVTPEVGEPTKVSDSSPSFLKNDRLKFILFGGKGGVGKTTSAAATAVYLARTRPHAKVLVFSTDPAHSLGDSLACPLEDQIKPVPGWTNLFAAEMDAEKMHRGFQAQHTLDLMELTERSTFFGIKQLAKTFGLSYPTSFNLMAMLRLMKLAEDYETIIIDTAPTGHTLMFLELLFELPRQLDAMEDSQAKHRYMISRYYGDYKKDKTDKFLDRLREDVLGLRSILTGLRTEFVPVTIAEKMSIFETRRLVGALRRRRFQIPVRNIVVNGLNPSAECGLCTSRHQEEERYVEEIEQTFPGKRIIRIPLFPREIRGDRLWEYAAFLSDGVGESGKALKPVIGRVGGLPVPPPPPAPASLSHLLERKEIQFFILGGKGGVGKTTSAAATAVYLASTRPRAKVLIFSTDPAHSLADSFASPIRDRATPISGFPNLEAWEVDPERKFAAFKSEYEKKIREAFVPEPSSGSVMGVGIQSATVRTFDEAALIDLISAAPLGLDEVMALADTVMSVVKEYEFIVIDTAPTGHLIKLFQRPEIVLEWFTTIIQGIKQHYTGFMRAMEVIRFLLEQRKRLLEIFKLLSHEKTEFVAVTIAELMGVYETQRLLEDLRDLKVRSKNAIVNKIVPPSSCPFCSTKRAEQLAYIQEIQGRFQGFTIVSAPLFSHEVRGTQDLAEFAAALYGGDEPPAHNIGGNVPTLSALEGGH